MPFANSVLTHQRRGFIVSQDSIGTNGSMKKYLVLVHRDTLWPLLNKTNRNVIQAKCRCQMFVTSRRLVRKRGGDAWVKYQLLIVLAPSRSMHLRAKSMIEALLPCSERLLEYADTATTRLRCSELLPDNLPLLQEAQRSGITHYKLGYADRLTAPRTPVYDKIQNSKSPWKLTEREARGVSVPTNNILLERHVDLTQLMEALLNGMVEAASGRKTLFDSDSDSYIASVEDD